MKIAFVVHQLNIGGLERVTVKVANELSALYNIDLIVLNTDFKKYEVKDTICVNEGKIKYSLIGKVKRKLKRIITKSYAVHSKKELRYLENIIKANNYDVIVACDGGNAMLVNEVLKIKNLNSNIKFITWVHNDYNTYFHNYFKIFKSELGDALSASDTVITLTKADQKDYLKWNKRTTYIYNPITINNAQISNLTNKEILFVARLVKEQKGLDYLIEIAKKIQNTGWKIRVVGDGKDGEWFRQEVRANALQNCIILHGNVTHNIQEFYGNASIFISTSRWEGFGLVLTEAMACGLPIISFDNSGPHEILDGGQYGILIPKYDVDAFANSIIELINNHDLLQNYAQKSLLRVSRFSTETIISNWEGVMNKL